tara:strand:+ start:174 stop:926 length:753 start_codon:yes stop_codon:yes gene_type:complete
MKQFIAIFSFLTLSLMAHSQGPDYKVLRILYADGNYEKLVQQAEKYTLKDKTKKDIPPYFWLAKGLYKISISGTDDPDFKNAYKSAIKYLSKGIKYDLKYNDGDMAVEEAEFVGDFQMTLYETIANEIGAGSFKRASGWVIKYQKLSTNTIGAKYMMGACKYNDGDKTTARDYWRQADAALAEIESIDNYTEADRKMFMVGALHSARALTDSRQDSKAKTLLGKISQWFEEDEDWQDLYDEIVNKPKESN